MPLELSSHIADLLLVSDGSETAVREPKVRVVWHFFLFSLIGYFLICTTFNGLVKPLLLQNPLAAQLWRIFTCTAIGYFIILICVLAYRHYICLLRTGIDLRFSIIAFFYFLTIYLFGVLYSNLFLFDPKLFVCANPVVIPSPFLMNLGTNNFLLLGDFFLYSGCVACSITYPRIASGSWQISALNLAQVLFSLSMVGILIATIIQKSDHGKRTTV